jgi:hypothetical protein
MRLSKGTHSFHNTLLYPVPVRDRLQASSDDSIYLNHDSAIWPPTRRGQIEEFGAKKLTIIGKSGLLLLCVS